MRKKVPWVVLLMLICAAGLGLLDHFPGIASRPTPLPQPEAPREKRTAGAYEIYDGCRLTRDPANDGDSFRVRLPDGREEIFRLYYVDSPESRFRRYQNGETNYKRIREQALQLGGITPEQAVQIGQKAKHYTSGILSHHTFTLHTQWDSPFRDKRYHAFVQVVDSGKPRWLHELLIERGLARLKTKPAPLPDGTPVDVHRQHLLKLQQQAKKANAGAWEFAPH